MRGKSCWRLGDSATEISKNREAAGGWLRLEDEGMKKRWKGKGAGVFFGRLRGRRKAKGKSWTRGEGTVGAVVGSLPVFSFVPCVFLPLFFSLSKLSQRLSSFQTSFPFQFQKSPLSSPKILPLSCWC